MESTAFSILQKYQAERNAEAARVAAEKQEAIEKQLAASATAPKRFSLKNVSTLIRKQVQSLPIQAAKEEIIKAIRKNQVVVVVGDTGSGKSTQIPKFLVEAGYADKGMIGITQPRRVAAKSLAERLCDETGEKLGEMIGYAVRFDRQISTKTVLKFMTDGLLVKECTQDVNLDNYSVIMVDEAHERSVHTDVCFGLLKRAAKNRDDLKIIISSATLNIEEFENFFDAAVFRVEGRTFPVQKIYQHINLDTMGPVADVVLNIHLYEPEGDILVFLCGQDDIEFLWEALDEKVSFRTSSSILHILPCYGALPLEEQKKIFEPTPPGYRKVVLATNIAETSLTVDGVVYVIDCGTFKQSKYNPRTKITNLEKLSISQFQAEQRSGRAGRTRPGKCYRLYSEYQYKYFQKSAIPEIERCDIGSVLLDIISMGVKDPLKFEFLSKPSERTMCESLEHLQELSALDKNLELTEDGRLLAKLPLEPPLAKVLIAAAKLGCVSETLKIVAMLTIQQYNIFSRSKKNRALADRSKAQFNQDEGDHHTLLNVYNRWALANFSESWCKENFIQYRYMKEAEEVRLQLTDILAAYNLNQRRCSEAFIRENIQKAFTAGYFRQLAKKKSIGHGYHMVSIDGINDDIELNIHPSSALFKKMPHPTWIIYHEVMKTTKNYMRGVVQIDPNWVKQYAPSYAKKIKLEDSISYDINDLDDDFGNMF